MYSGTFFLDGVDAADFGISLSNEMSFSEPVPIREVETIPGRNGDIAFFTGSFENRSGNADCFILRKNAMDAVGAANKFLLSKRGYRRLQTSDDPDHYWLAMVENGVEIENIKNAIIPFSVGFDCKPQRFLIAGEEKSLFFEDGEIFNHYGFDALPIVKVYGEGGGLLRIGDSIIEILENDGVLFVDSDTQNVYNETENKNKSVYIKKFPVLCDGKNVVSFSGGVSKIEIIPRWWEL